MQVAVMATEIMWTHYAKDKLGARVTVYTYSDRLLL